MPVDRLKKVLQQITIHLYPVLNFLRRVKSEFTYALYADKQVQAVTYDGLIRLPIKIPLPRYSVEFKRHIQIGYSNKLLAVSADLLCNSAHLTSSWRHITI